MADKKPDNFSEKMERSRQMESGVRGLLHHGQVASAKKAFSGKWEECLPSMPIRFTVQLDDGEAKSITRLLEGVAANEVLEKLNSIELHIAKRLDPRHPERAAVYYQDVAQGRRHVVGFLPEDVLADLMGFGAARRAYATSFREIHGLQDDTVIVVEFVRPEMHICSSCGEEHFEETINCKNCRAKRRRKNYELEDAKEQAVAVPVSGALHKIQEQRFQREGELKKKPGKD